MPKIISTFDLEKKCLDEGYDFVIGIDEAGRGPLAGPVVACACALRNFSARGGPAFGWQIFNGKNKKTKYWDLIRDSKTLSEKQRESLFDFICENFYVGLGICDHKTIDRMNILEASFLAMKKAIVELKSKIIRHGGQNYFKEKSIIVVDGNKIIPNLSMEQKAVIGGDKLIKSISAASIVAKVTRDRIIREADEIYPGYGFAAHKGYGTRKHFEALKKYGPCEIHRKSFAPVKNMF